MTGDVVHVEGITLGGIPETVNAGDVFAITADVRPADATNKAVSFTSSDETVLCVSEDGTVTALSNGTAVITAAAADGSDVSASAEITVGAELLDMDVYYLTGDGVEGAMEASDNYQVLKYTADSVSGWGGIHINKADTGSSASTTGISLNVGGVQTAFDKGISANADAQIIYDLSDYAGVEKQFQAWVGIDYVKYGKTGRDGASFRFYKDSVAEENLLYDTGAIVQQDEAQFVSIDVTDVQTLILTADKGNSNSDDCVDWADAKIYMKAEPEVPAEPLDTAILEYALELAASADTDGVVSSVADRFNAAVADGQALLDRVNAGDDTVTQAMIDQSWSDIITMMQYLSFKQGDKSDLEAVIRMAEGLDLSKYIESTLEGFDEALTAANGVYADGDAMQDEVDAAWKALLKEMSEMRLTPDKDALAELIQSASGLNEADYEAASFQAVLSALAEAQTVFDDSEAVQEEVDSAVSALQEAMSRLVQSPEDAQTPGNTENTENTGNTDGAQASGGAQSIGDTAEQGTAAEQTDSAGRSGAGSAEGTSVSAGSAVRTGDSPMTFLWGTAAVLSAGAAALSRRKVRK